MPTTETAPRDDSPGLSSSRADFAANLQRRLDAATGALLEFEQQPTSSDRRNDFLRRVHALRASAKVLGFAAASEALSTAEQQIRTCPVESPGDDIRSARKQLELLPSLVLRGTYSLAPPSPQSVRPKSLAPMLSEPLALVVSGTPELVETVRSIERSTNCLEVTLVEDPDALRSTCAAIGPDVLLLDANQGSITLLVTDLTQAPEASAIPIVVANVPDLAAEGLKELGVRIVLPPHANEHQLSQALFQVRHAPQQHSTTPNTIGQVTLNELAEHLAQEIRNALVESAISEVPSIRMDFGNATALRAALWSALAQIREQIVETSAGRIQFGSGPDGAEPIAPRNLPTARNRALSSGVDLTGRRVLVADDDPAVAWFVGGTLRAAGAIVTEVHDGAQALELAYHLWPEFIVSDILMPGLDGFALCQAIKRDVLLRDLPILLLSWKEDLLFRLRELGADADGYLRKEASASTIVRRVKELLLPRSALERRLAVDQESRGRLDGFTARLLLEIAASLERPVRIALRDANALYDLRVRHGTLLSASRTRHDGAVERGESVLGALLGITAARFSVITDREGCDSMFSGSLSDVLRPSALRARAAQRLLCGQKLAMVERLTLAPDVFGAQVPLLPLSLRPLAEELLRGAAPKTLLASGVAPAHLLESLLLDLARRGAVLSIQDDTGRDLLDLELQSLQNAPIVQLPKPAQQQAPRFTFQLPSASDDLPRTAPLEITLTRAAPEVADALQPPAAAVVQPDHARDTIGDRSSAAGAAGGPAVPPGLPASDESNAVPDEAPASIASEGASMSVADEPDRLRVVVKRGVPTDDAQAPVANEPKRFVSPREEVRALSETPVRPAFTSGAPTGAYTPVTSLIPQQVAVSSKPPPSDDFDWALELSWDTTPPPGNSTRPPPAMVTASPAAQDRAHLHPAVEPSAPVAPDRSAIVNPSGSQTTALAGGFMGVGSKPASLPDMASRHRGAAATTEPSSAPDWAAPVQLTQRKTHPSSDIAVPVRPSQISTDDSGSGSPPLAHPNRAASHPDDARSNAAHREVERFSAESPIALPVVNQPPRPKNDGPTEQDPQLHPGPRKIGESSNPEDPVFPLVSAATPHLPEIRSAGDIRLPLSTDTLANPKLAKPGRDLPTATASDTLRSPATGDDSATAAAPQETPPCPEKSAPVDGALDLQASSPRSVTNAAPDDPHRGPPQPSPADVDAAAEVPLAHATAPEVAAQPQSPKAPSVESTRHEPDISTQGQPRASAHNAARTLLSSSEPNRDRPRPEVARTGTHSHPRPTPMPPRQVGWLQALGLATLAGLVTFAATVPIASWIHRRNERAAATAAARAQAALPPDVASEVPSPSDQPPADPKGLVADTLASVAVADPSAAAPKLSAGVPSSSEIPVPPNVVLKPGEGVIEVSTGGDHAVFVDDAFVGRGPLRVVPVNAGHHVVRTRLNGAERSDSIDIIAGRAVRLSLEQAWN